MAQFTLHRSHRLGTPALRTLLQRWMEDGQQRFGLHCEHASTDEAESVAFSRTGVSGRIFATATELTLTVQLGFLLSPYQKRIEATIQQQLDEAFNANATPQNTSASPNQ